MPIWFDGANSRMFQIASHLQYTLRMALLIKEFRARVDEPVRVAIGAPIPSETLALYRHDATAMMDFPRARTYAWSRATGAPPEFEYEGSYRA